MNFTEKKGLDRKVRKEPIVYIIKSQNNSTI